MCEHGAIHLCTQPMFGESETVEGDEGTSTD